MKPEKQTKKNKLSAKSKIWKKGAGKGGKGLVEKTPRHKSSKEVRLARRPATTKESRIHRG